MKKILFVLFLFFVSSICLADEYILVMSKDNAFCYHMLKLYNKDLEKYGQVRYDLHEEFNWIKWQEKGIRLRPPSDPPGTTGTGISAKIALFDINNDSKDELVVYSEGMFSNRPTYDYDVFSTDFLPILNCKEIIDGKLYYSKVLKSFSSAEGIPIDVYDISKENIKKLPKRMGEFVEATKARGEKDEYFIGLSKKIKFLKFRDHYYIVFKGPRGIGPGEEWDNVEQYSLISEYRQDNTLNHQCLYLIKKDNPAKRKVK